MSVTETSKIFAIEMLPAQQGDALWIEYGSRTRPHRILIDGGTPPTVEHLKARIESLSEKSRRFELVVVTHIDTDHIGGMLKLVSTLGVSTGDLWFNAWRHLPGATAGRLGPIDGEILNLLLDHTNLPWNQAFGGGAVQVPDDEEAPLPTCTLAAGMKITVLSPTSAQLVALKKEWRKVIHEEGLDRKDLDTGLAEAMRRKGIRRPGTLGAGTPDVDRESRSPFVSDRAVANSSSIGLLAEFGGKACLLTGDAFVPVLEAGVRRLLAERDKPALTLNALKVAHHGSKNNTSNTLLEVIRCGKYLISTDGSIFHHPDHQAVSRLIANGGRSPTMYFNYLSADNQIWKDPALVRRYKYRAVFPESDQNGFLRVEL